MRNVIINIFCCYAHKDKLLRDALRAHLGLLSRLGHINVWYDGEILPGSIWEKSISDQLDSAQIILLLISADFVNSDYCYSIEMKRALERHRLGDACVIPILLRPVDFEGAPFASLEMLPPRAKPVMKWSNRDEAFMHIAQEVRKTVNRLREAKPFQQAQRESKPPLTSTRPGDFTAQPAARPIPFGGPPPKQSRTPFGGPPPDQNDDHNPPSLGGQPAIIPASGLGGPGVTPDSIEKTERIKEGPINGTRPDIYGMLNSSESEEAMILVQQVFTPESKAPRRGFSPPPVAGPPGPRLHEAVAGPPGKAPTDLDDSLQDSIWVPPGYQHPDSHSKG